MRLIKLTDPQGRTYGGIQWGEGVTNQAKPGDGPLCSEYWIHAYRTPLLAVLCNPAHANFSDSIGWEAEGEIGLEDGLKVGCKALTTIRRITLPIVSVLQSVRWGILSALAVPQPAAFHAWAEGWLSGHDRSEEAAWAAAAATATTEVAAGVAWATATAWAKAAAEATTARAATAAAREATAAAAAAAEKAAVEATTEVARAAWAAATATVRARAATATAETAWAAAAAAAEATAVRAAGAAAAAAAWAGASIDFVSLAAAAVAGEP
mgnify:CR=1 FL=1